MCIFHKWRNIQKKGFDVCMGESYITLEPSEYDICIKCGDIKKPFFTTGLYRGRREIDEGAEQIIRRKLENGELPIEGGINYKDIKEK
jgi:hypothetical protein